MLPAKREVTTPTWRVGIVSRDSGYKHKRLSQAPSTSIFNEVMQSPVVTFIFLNDICERITKCINFSKILSLAQSGSEL